MLTFSAPSAPYPHHVCKVRKTARFRSAAPPSIGGAGVRCGECGCGQNNQIRTLIFRTLKGA